MWIDVRHPILVKATFSRQAASPRLDCFRTQGDWIQPVVVEAVESDSDSLRYVVAGPSSRYMIQYDMGQQRWYLDGIDASGHLRAMPRPRCFPPP